MGLFSGITKAFKSVGSVLDPFGGLISGGLSYMGATSANAANAEQAQLNRDFQERMRATQYQTSVDDLKKAGLNPMLAYQNGGAGNVSGAVAAPYQNALGQGVSSSLQARQNIAQVQNLEEQNKLIPAQVQQTLDSARYLRQQQLTEVAREFRETQAANIDKQRLEIDRFLAHSLANLQLSQARNYDSNSAYTALRNYQDSLNSNALKYDKEARDSWFGERLRKSGTMLGDFGSIFKFGRK